MKKKLTNLALIIAGTLLITACDDSAHRRDTIGKNPKIMIDESGNHWIVKHHIGALYRVEFLGDSTFQLFKAIQK